jgi:hypothetical protein
MFFIGFPVASGAKCWFPPVLTAEIELEQCQGVRFDASTSKKNSLPGKPPILWSYEGGSVVGALLVGKVMSSHFEKGTSAINANNPWHIHPFKWEKGSTKTLFVAGDAQAI